MPSLRRDGRHNAANEGGGRVRKNVGEEGLLEGIAKGAHRPKNSFQGPFDLAAIYDLVYLKRKNPGLSILA